jgi:hypothetical protein
MKTKQDVTINYRDSGNIMVPGGTTVTNMTACGIDKNYHFVNDFAWITKNYPTIASILKHDAMYYGINIPKEFIDFE